MSEAHFPLLQVKDLCKSFRSVSRAISVLNGLELEIPHARMIAIMGASGVGKSTLLHLLGGLDRPDDGEIRFQGNNIANYTAEQLAEFRNSKIGFVFQMHHLLPEFNALENVMLPFLIRDYDRSRASSRAREVLQEVGLADRQDHRPGQLSGGEQQRAAIARALMRTPVLVLADEPTGNLDEQTGDSIFQLFRDLHSRHEISFLIATHNPRLASICDEVYLLHDGKLERK